MPDIPDPTFSISLEVRAAMDRWDHLAAFAWDRYLGVGRGAVIVARAELVAQSRSTETTAALEPGYVPIDYIPKNDDFLPLMHQYDPDREFLLVVSDAEKPDMLLRMQSDGESRPTPQQCWAQSEFAAAKE